MARLLYRLGAFSARRAWAVMAAWALLLALLGGTAVAFGKPLSTKLSIPGTEFQTVLDDLQTSVPEAAHGTAVVVFRTATGQPFTAAQRDAVATTVSAWGTVPGVDHAINPFTSQNSLDDSRTKVADGRTKLDEGQRKLDDALNQLATGRAKLKDGRVELTKGAEELKDGKVKLEAGQDDIDAGRARLQVEAAKLEAGRRQAEAGAAQLAAGVARAEAGKKQLDSAQAELNQKKAQLDQGLAKIQASIAQAKQGKVALEQARNRLAQLTPVIQGLQAQLNALPSDDPQRETLHSKIVSLQTQQSDGLAQLKEEAEKLTGGLAKLLESAQTLNAGKQKLQAGQKTLNQKWATYKAGAAVLAQKKQELAAGQAKISNGEKQLAAGRAKLDAGQAKIDANRAKLAAGQKKYESGVAELEAAAAKIKNGEVEWNNGKSTLVQKTKEFKDGERRLALMDGLRTVNPAGNVAVGRIMFTEGINSVPAHTKEDVRHRADNLATAGVQIDYSKDISQNLNFAGPAELIGVAVAALVLLVMLGSLLAAGLPLLVALIGVGVGLTSVMALTPIVTMNDITPALALMLGLAVGIDYALFLVHRHREQLARGMELHESIALATGTAGSAVTFAGLTVLVALAALSLTGIPFLGVMGFAAAGTVLAAVLVSLTLTPAALALLGQRVLSAKARRQLQAELAQEEEEASLSDAEERTHRPVHEHRGWGGVVTRHPWLTLVASTLVMGIVAIPAASLRLGLPDGSSEPSNSTAYRNYSTISQEFGPGQNAGIIAVAKVKSEAASNLNEAARSDLNLDIAERLKGIPGVSYVLPVGTSPDHRTLAYQIVPTTGPTDDATITLVHNLRDARGDIVATTPVESLGFAGQTVANIDISQMLAEALPLYLGVVVGISLILLLLVFRSVWVPILATGGFLLSVAAAFGAVVAVYQWGWLGGLFGVEHPGTILSFLPTLVIGILFGLAMDYQMFIVSGMREAWSHGHTARTAVRTGFSHGARVVTAAALIMTAVFASFLHSGLTMIRPIGFGLAVGVLIDAFVVRMTCMPAVMHLLGERAWWLPSWLDRILPRVDVEGSTFVRPEPVVVAETSADNEPYHARSA